MTFKEAYTELLDIAGVSGVQFTTQAKREINNAIQWCQRKHRFKDAEALAEFVYPAGALVVELEEVCGGRVLEVHSAERLHEEGANRGVPYKIIEHASLVHYRKRLYDQNLTDADYCTWASGRPQFIDEYGRHRTFLALTGSGVELFPTPLVDVNILLHFTKDFARLVEDSDTNFFLERAGDVIVDLAYWRFNRYLPAEKRSQNSESDMGLVMSNFNSFIDWDNRLRASAGIEWNV